MHCFLFPSLHDSSGNVVLEAQANGLPVICLDLGGPATLVTPETACVVKTRGLDESDVVRRMAEALEKLASDENLRMAMARSALIRAATSMTWESRVYGALALLEVGRAHSLASPRKT
jgi:glycosyltransferase involved in cell wall biosynthesis